MLTNLCILSILLTVAGQTLTVDTDVEIDTKVSLFRRPNANIICLPVMILVSVSKPVA